MIVKICGIKTIEEALSAIDAGADMLGFNFYPPSARYIEREACINILTTLKAMGKQVTSVGVFVNQSAQQVQATLEMCALDLAQLSGDEPPAWLADLRGRAYKAVRPASQAEAETLLAQYDCHGRPALLVDANVRGAYGGTGEVSHWPLAQHLAARAPVLLAGGLTPQNVAAAIRAVRPWGVDVASGVQSSPGVKEAAKMAAFITAARAIS